MDILKIMTYVFVALIITSVGMFGIKKMKPNIDIMELEVRLKMWWGMSVIFGLATLLSPHISLVSLMILCLLTLREYFSIVKMKKGDRRILFWAYLSVPFQFYWIFIEWYGMFIIFIPIYVFLFMPLPKIFSGITGGFLRNVSVIQWGLMLMVFGLSHLAYIPKLSDEHGGKLVMFLVIITQLGDVVQYITSKLIGKHKIVPTADKNKTWEGFIVSLLINVPIAVFLTPLMTPMSTLHGFLAGLMIIVIGFFGSVVIAMVKRDVSLDGKNGTAYSPEKSYLSKIDSLIFTVPLFFHFVRYLYF